MDGRVKTLHPGVHGGLLAIRDDAEHVAAMSTHGITAIDLAIINLYPFEEVRAKGGDYPTTVENIDIGGPAMIRASAKNHAYVTIVTDPADYPLLLEELDAGKTTYAFRQKMAAKAYARTAAYDAAISNWFAEALDTAMPRHRVIGGVLKEEMRYGRTRIRRRASTSPARTAGRRHRDATAGQAAFLQQHQRYGCRLRTRRRIPAGEGAGLRHHQACQSVRRRHRADACRSLSPGACLRFHLGFRRYHRAQPGTRCGDGGRNRQAVHRSDHRSFRE